MGKFQQNYAVHDRKSMIAKIHIAKTQMKLDEATYRATLLSITGYESCRELSLVQLRQVLDEFRRLGFKPTNPKGKNYGIKPRVPHSKQALMNKIEAILTDLGLAWSYADSMARTMFDIDKVEWLGEKDLYKLTQAIAVYQARKQRRNAT